MKREIKFKFWLGHTKKMTYEHSLAEIAHLFWDFTEDIIPLQFIGLKDKNGKDIYEGDIVKCDGGSFPAEVVWFEGGQWALETHIEETRNNPMESYYFNECEVIGNIYETKELI